MKFNIFDTVVECSSILLNGLILEYPNFKKIELNTDSKLTREQVDVLRDYIANGTFSKLVYELSDPEMIKSLAYIAKTVPRIMSDGMCQHYVIKCASKYDADFYMFIKYATLALSSPYITSEMLIHLFEHSKFGLIQEILEHEWRFIKLTEVPKQFIMTVSRSIKYPLSNMREFPAKTGINWKCLYMLSQIDNFKITSPLKALYIDMIYYTGTARNMLALILSISYGRRVSAETLQFDDTAELMQGRGHRFHDLLNKQGAKGLIAGGSIFSAVRLNIGKSVIYYLNHKADARVNQKTEALTRIFNELNKHCPNKKWISGNISEEMIEKNGIANEMKLIKSL